MRWSLGSLPEPGLPVRDLEQAPSLGQAALPARRPRLAATLRGLATFSAYPGCPLIDHERFRSNERLARLDTMRRWAFARWKSAHASARGPVVGQCDEDWRRVDRKSVV